MKNPRALLMILVSVAVAIGAVVLASQWVVEQTHIATTKVVVARSDIDLGTQLTPQMLKVADWPTGSVPDGSAQEPEQLKDRVLKASLLSGEPVLESKLAPLGTKGGLSAVIGEGKRAMTVRVNDVIGVAGFALPGNYVDIVVNTEDDSSAAKATSSGNKSISKIVLEKILVLAVAQEASRDDTKPKVVNAVTLEVTPEEAEKLDLARSVGTLSLVLRNQLDASPVVTAGSTKRDMLDRAEPVFVQREPEVKERVVYRQVVVRKTAPRPKATAPAAAPAPKVEVEVIKGVEKTVQQF